MDPPLRKCRDCEKMIQFKKQIVRCVDCYIIYRKKVPKKQPVIEFRN